MKGFSPIKFIAGIGLMAAGVLVAGTIAASNAAAGLGGDFISLLFPLFPFFVGVFILIISFKHND